MSLTEALSLPWTVSLSFRSHHDIVPRIALYIPKSRGGTESGPHIFTDQVEHLAMNPTVACEQFRLIDRMRIAVKIRNAPSGFPHDHDSSCHVPGTEFDFP